jgi:hypothetical protein
VNERSSVDKLLFPVKRLGVVCLVLAGCGYQPIYAAASTESVCVRAAPSRVAELASVAAVLEGARRELARAGALSADERGPCLVVELLRVEENPSGIVAGRAGDREQPRARGNVVTATGRAWIERESGGPASRDTGDMARSSRAAGAGVISNEPSHYRSLVRAAAEDLGSALAQRALGLPTPTR